MGDACQHRVLVSFLVLTNIMGTAWDLSTAYTCLHMFKPFLFPLLLALCSHPLLDFLLGGVGTFMKEGEMPWMGVVQLVGASS